LSIALAWYDKHADAVASRYEAVNPVRLQDVVVNLLPRGQAAVLDVGAGTGRDAAWLAGQGLDVVAVEPSKAMREEATRRHADPRIQWVDDRLPELKVVSLLKPGGVLSISLRFGPATGAPRYAHALNLPGLRSWPLKRHPYLVFYVQRADPIDVWRVLHGSRDIPARMQEPEPA
jgi:toxin ParE1/3/4